MSQCLFGDCSSYLDGTKKIKSIFTSIDKQPKYNSLYIKLSGRTHTEWLLGTPLIPNKKSKSCTSYSAFFFFFTVLFLELLFRSSIVVRAQEKTCAIVSHCFSLTTCVDPNFAAATWKHLIGSFWVPLFINNQNALFLCFPEIFYLYY